MITYSHDEIERALREIYLALEAIERVDKRFAKIETKLAKLDEAIAQVDKRFAKIDAMIACNGR